MSVIPTCADLAHFSLLLSKRDKNDFVLGYVGSAGRWNLIEKVAACFAALRVLRPDVRVLILNRGRHAYIRDSLAKAGIPETVFELKAASHDEVPAEMARNRCRDRLYYKPSYSRAACAPTKLGVRLGCGERCLANVGVGDMTEVLEDDRVGMALKAFDAGALTDGLHSLLQLVAEPGTADRCATAAKPHFSLNEGVSRYAAVYEQMVARAFSRLLESGCCSGSAHFVIRFPC